MKKHVTDASSDYILDSSKEYALYVCENRAIPKVADGLKDGQRKALYLMSKKAEKIKTISLAGEMISSGLYLHGDASASETISALAGPYVNNVPWLYGDGNFGTRVNPTSWSAPRYTYVRRNKASMEIMYQDLAVVPMMENYDGSTHSPTHFLPIIPTVLLNGISGIAVGWATNILPRSFKDLKAATLAALDGKKVPVVVPGFDTMDITVNSLGDNAWEFTGRYDRGDTSSLRVTSLPPGMNLEKFKIHLDDLTERELIRDYTDKSAKEINVEVMFKRGELKNLTDVQVVKLLKLATRDTERIVVIGWNNKSIMQYGSAEELIKDFVEWRFNFYVERYKKMLADDSYELRYWQGVKACFGAKFAATLISKKNRQEVEDEITKITGKIGLDADQIGKIAAVSGYKWAADEEANVDAKITELLKNIAHYQMLIATPTKIRDIFRAEVAALKV